MSGVGVMDNQMSPTVDEIVAVARAAEDAGAEWLTLSDQSSWRDTWMMATVAAQATERIWLGPGVTNPYLRHPFHTVAALATLHDLTGGRAMLGVAAGGTPLTVAAGIPRRDAPQRVAGLIQLLRRVEAGAALDEDSGWPLELDLPSTPVLVSGRKDGMLRCAGAHADRALLFRIPQSDLERVAGVIRKGAATADRTSGPELVWCPLVAWDERIRPFLRAAAVWATVESPPELFDRWGIAAETRDHLRSVVVRDGIYAAADLVPAPVVDDVILPDPDPAAVAEVGRSIGATSIAIRNFDTATVPEGVSWARDVAARL